MCRYHARNCTGGLANFKDKWENFITLPTNKKRLVRFNITQTFKSKFECYYIKTLKINFSNPAQYIVVSKMVFGLFEKKYNSSILKTTGKSTATFTKK